MKIVGFKADNFKRLQAVEITPAGNTMVIGGRNEQGKSSILDAIQAALGGLGVQPRMPIRSGQEKAEVVLKLGGNGEELTVRRSWTAKGSYMTVTNGDGLKGGQAVLDRLLSQYTFDPLEFTRLKAGAQVDTMRRLAGIGAEFDQLELQRRDAYDKRTTVNTTARSMRARVEAMPHHPDAPEQEVSVDQLLEQRRQLEQRRTERQKAHQELQAMEQIVQGWVDRVAKQEAAIEDIKKRLAAARENLTKLEHGRDQASHQLESMTNAAAELPDVDTSAIDDQIRQASAVNAQVQANRARAAQLRDVEQVEQQAKQLTDQIDRAIASKQRMIEQAKLPVEGLAFTPEGVTYRGVPFEQCSSAERLRVSTAMGMAANPSLRVMLIRDGSLLDEQHLAIIADMARENDYQIWIERVGNGDECGVIIEDGQVVEVRPVASA